MKKLIIMLIFFLIGSLHAQSITEFNVAVFPDYFNNAVTIEYSGSVNSADLPITVGFLVPSETDSILQISGSNAISRIRSDVIDNESWVFLTVEEEQFRLFVFAPPFGNPIGERNYNFTFKSDQDFSNAHIVIQEPINAENFLLLTAGSEPSTDQHGLTFHRYHIDNQLANTEINIAFQYVNPTGLTTLEALQTTLSEGGNSPTPTRASGDLQQAQNIAPDRFEIPYWQPFTVLLLLAVVIGIIVKQSETVSKPVKPDGQFCSNCGKPIVKSDKFCANCGHKLK